MKIALNMNQGTTTTGAVAQDCELERLIRATRDGDRAAKARLAKMFLPVIQDVASKHGGATEGQSLLVDAGRCGVVKAAKHYRSAQGPHGFRVAVVEYIERAVERAAKGSLLYKLFGV